MKKINAIIMSVAFFLIFTISAHTVFAESNEKFFNNTTSQNAFGLNKISSDVTNNTVKTTRSVEYPARVVVATGANFPDALVAVPIASWLDEYGVKQCTPIMLVSDKLPPGFSNTYDSIRDQIEEVCIMGGVKAVSSSIESQLRQYFYKAQIYRYSGATRYDTAVDAALKEWSSGSSGVIITRGDLFPDAVAAGPLASYLSWPILLVQPKYIPYNTKQAIQKLGANEAIILGSPAAISSDVERELKNMGLNITRLGGSDRYETAKKIAEYYTSILREDGIFVNDVIITTGKSFPDALAGGPLGFMRNAPVLFVKNEYIPDATIEAVNNINPEFLTIIGGPSVVSLAIDVYDGLYFAIGRIAGLDRYETACMVARILLYEVLPTKWHDYALVVGNPNKGTNWDLPWAETEANYIAYTLQDAGFNVKKYIGSEATWSSVVNYLASGVGIFHFTGHGYFDESNYKNSGLVLTDYYLTVNDVMGSLNLGGEHPIVFANACQSGITVEDWSRSLIGLSTSFIFKGAISYIGTLDSVWDVPAAYLGADFYEEIIYDNDPIGIALRDAKRWLMDNGYVGYYGPYGLDTWQAFVLFGDPLFNPGWT